LIIFNFEINRLIVRNIFNNIKIFIKIIPLEALIIFLLDKSNWLYGFLEKVLVSIIRIISLCNKGKRIIPIICFCNVFASSLYCSYSSKLSFLLNSNDLYFIDFLFNIYMWYLLLKRKDTKKNGDNLPYNIYSFYAINLFALRNSGSFFYQKLNCFCRN
jgi:hypothetical protein